MVNSDICLVIDKKMLKRLFVLKKILINEQDINEFTIYYSNRKNLDYNEKDRHLSSPH